MIGLKIDCEFHDMVIVSHVKVRNNNQQNVRSRESEALSASLPAAMCNEPLKAQSLALKASNFNQ